MPTSSLGTKLQELRNSRNLTQKQISDALNIVRATYAYYELDKRTPDLQTLLLICKFYNITISELINEDTIPIPKDSGANAAPNTDITVVGTAGMVRTALAPSIVNLALNIFSHREKKFIELFRQLTPENQDEILHIIKYKVRKQKNNRQP